MLPARPKAEDDDGSTSSLDGSGGGDGEKNLGVIIKRMAKKRSMETTMAADGKRKRLKTEPY